MSRLPKPIFYLHIPKTAGSAFIQTLQQHSGIPPERQQTFIHAIDFALHPPEHWEQFDLLTGHVVYFPNRYLTFEPHYLTLLRDPVERTISNWAYIRDAGEWHPSYEDVRGQSLYEFVTDPRTIPLSDNFQMRYLLFDMPLEPFRDRVPDDDPEQYRLYMHKIFDGLPLHEYGLPDDEALALAKQRLDDCAVVGLQERLPASAALMCHTFGWPIPPQPAPVNVTAKRPPKRQIDGKTLDAIHRITELDAQLYAHARRLFQDRLLAMLQQMAEAAAGKQRLQDDVNRLQEQLHAERAAHQQAQATLQSMQQSRAWQMIERWWRWTGRISAPDNR